MGLNVWVLILLAIALSGAVGYLAGQSRVWRNSSERIHALKRTYEERLEALAFGASGSKPSLPRTSPRRLGPAPYTAASAPRMQSPA
jgi:hypothetical protein